jgi:RHH-type proline utilization regulon transcriptional repressor/proline dehydrogenase/delta 1-pyrroline-5-carboxylate dehydrogenase
MAAPTGVETPPSFLFADPDDFLTPVGRAINADFLGDEDRIVRRLADAARFDPVTHDAVQVTARQLVEAVRKAPASKTGLDAFLRQYDLSSQEGVILM